MPSTSDKHIDVTARNNRPHLAVPFLCAVAAGGVVSGLIGSRGGGGKTEELGEWVCVDVEERKVILLGLLGVGDILINTMGFGVLL
jgi:hypothetical protein